MQNKAVYLQTAAISLKHYMASSLQTGI